MVAVIGDIHGCFHTLRDLVNNIKDKFPDIQIYAIGDLVDRGNYSYETINYILENNIFFTPGNHDYMFYHFFKDPQSIFARSWVFNGNESTLESYEQYENAIFPHIDAIKNSPLYFNLEDCFISHAGISIKYQSMLPENFRDDLSILHEHIYNDAVTDRGVLWTRDNLLNLGKLQIVGHTKHKDITLDEDSRALYIDTGACVGNKLSAVIVNKNEIVDTIEEKTHLNDIIL